MKITSDNQQRTLLTIEDDTIVRKAIAAYLRGHNYNVLEASDGEEGVALYRKAKPDIVLTDLRLPKVDGMEILSTIHSDASDTPVIVVSGMGTLDDAIKALKLGAVDYVTKPISDMALLHHSIKKALERVELVRENKRYQTHLEEEIERRTAELQQAQKLEAIGTLAGGIAHDFNNILGAIMGFTDLALLKVENNIPLEKDLQQVKQAAHRAKELVLQILTFSRKSETKKHPIQLSLIIKETLKLLRATLPATTHLSQHVEARDAKILADPIEIHQVLTNLFTNAFHALPEEKGEVSVTLRLRQGKGSSLEGSGGQKNTDLLELQVKDDGCGMDRETIAQIFDPFFTTKEKGLGTGLGLSVVHGIVTDCGGTIDVISTPGEGTRFTLLFPVVEGEDAMEVIASLDVQGGCESILLVDDEEPLRELGSRMLSYLGYSVECCASGPEALQLLQKSAKDYDLLVTDQSMPGMPGTELIREVQKIAPDLPVLLCTGFSSMIDEETVQELGVNGFILKPLTMKTLSQEVRKILK